MRAIDNNARLNNPGRDDEDDDYEDEEYDEYDEDEDEDEDERPLSTSDAARAGLRHITELTGKEPSGVVSLEPAEGGWVVGVEVIEDRRIPSSADILGLYQAEIAADGSLLAYRRSNRYSRGKGDGGSEVGLR